MKGSNKNMSIEGVMGVMYCPSCGMALAKSECRQTLLDEVSLGGAGRDGQVHFVV